MDATTQSRHTGLTAAQVLESRNINGANKILSKKRSLLPEVISGLVKEPMLLLLVVAATIYFVTGARSEGMFMFGAIIAISAISIYQDSKSQKALEALKLLTQPQGIVIRDGKEQPILREDIVVDDLLVIEEGVKIAADGRIVESHDFSVNESILTGESLSLEKNTEDEIFQGTLATSGRAVIKVIAVGDKTRLGQIGLSLNTIEEEPTPLQLQINDFVKKMAIIGGIIFLTVWAINYASSHAFLNSLLKGLTLAMSILPEEIPVAFTTFMALGAWRLMKMGVIVKKTQMIETLGSATVICTDKTGTITENKMKLAKMYIRKSGAIIQPEGNLDENALELLKISMWASEPIPFDPMEISIHETCKKRMPSEDFSSSELIHEYPLEGKPPMMTHIFRNQSGKLIIAAKGAPEALIAVSKLNSQEIQNINEAVQSLASLGFRVLGVGEVLDTNIPFPEKQQQFSFQFLGLVCFYDPPKANIKKVLDSFYQAGIQVKIITGDNAATTRHIAGQIGFENAEKCITGDRLMALPAKELEMAVQQNFIFARMFPEAKLRVINALKSQGQIVAMTGDGVNDGPALKAAHIGVAMGKGTEIAKQASSLILVDDDLGKMVDAVAMGRKIYASLKNAIRYIISIHIPIILIVFIPLALGWIYPNIFTPVHIIFLELIMGPTCSIIYENEPMENDVLLQRPRPTSTTFFSIKELSVSLLQGIVITLGLLIIYLYGWRNEFGESLIRSMIFIDLISANITLTLINRSFRHSILSTLRYKNRLVPLIIGITVALTIAIFVIPPINRFFSLDEVTWSQLSMAVTVGFISTIWYEGVKLFQRK